MENRTPYQNDDLYYDFDGVVCPVCGGRIKHPYTGEVTSEQIDEDINTCLWMEVINEYDVTLGWTPICKNIHPYTLEEENHNYIHYDMLEVMNCQDEMTLAEKIEYITKCITSLYPDVKREDIKFTVQDNKFTEIYVNTLKELVIDLNIDEEGNIVVNPV